MSGCGNYRVTHTALVPINNVGKFSSSGSFYANATFGNSTVNPASATGTLGLSSFPISGCGYVSGGPYGWSATWKTSAQPSSASTGGDIPVMVVRALEAPSDFLTIERVTR